MHCGKYTVYQHAKQYIDLTKRYQLKISLATTSLREKHIRQIERERVRETQADTIPFMV